MRACMQACRRGEPECWVGEWSGAGRQEVRGMVIKVEGEMSVYVGTIRIRMS